MKKTELVQLIKEVIQESKETEDLAFSKIQVKVDKELDKIFSIITNETDKIEDQKEANKIIKNFSSI